MKSIFIKILKLISFQVFSQVPYKKQALQACSIYQTMCLMMGGMLLVLLSYFHMSFFVE